MFIYIKKEWNTKNETNRQATVPEQDVLKVLYTKREGSTFLMSTERVKKTLDYRSGYSLMVEVYGSDCVVRGRISYFLS